jgi:hypothetical protein
MAGKQAVRRDAHPIRDPAAVLADLVLIVVGAGSGVEIVVDTGGDAPPAGEEAVSDAGFTGTIKKRRPERFRSRVNSHVFSTI